MRDVEEKNVHFVPRIAADRRSLTKTTPNWVHQDNFLQTLDSVSRDHMVRFSTTQSVTNCVSPHSTQPHGRPCLGRATASARSIAITPYNLVVFVLLHSCGRSGNGHELPETREQARGFRLFRKRLSLRLTSDSTLISPIWRTHGCSQKCVRVIKFDA